ncbi:hypothetical protein AVEN_92227-1 [Araneus ventricosus]|uniref:Uncharacterized protein n=1 Tax=Araneus ventricosus TaxID=182803 RepID=A0A4Y2AMT4_ARAVE|nr:hypothetical protein AVEN_92227-1 [Araneus ventricosus]
MWSGRESLTSGWIFTSVALQVNSPAARQSWPSLQKIDENWTGVFGSSDIKQPHLDHRDINAEMRPVKKRAWMKRHSISRGNRNRWGSRFEGGGEENEVEARSGP